MFVRVGFADATTYVPGLELWIMPPMEWYEHEHSGSRDETCNYSEYSGFRIIVPFPSPA